jgi:two-component system, LuxR family, response regulator FixJ
MAITDSVPADHAFSVSHAHSVVHVVDDDAQYRTALTRLLTAAGFEVRKYASSAELLAEVSAEQPGCVVADLRMPGLNGLELQESFAKAGVAMPFVFLTAYGDLRSAVSAMQHGAVDFLDKSAPREELLAAVRSALERDEVARAANERQQRLRQRFASLTQRETEVLRFVVLGKLNKQIAAELGIHERTVKLHRQAINAKVGARSVAQLATLVRDARLMEA